MAEDLSTKIVDVVPTSLTVPGKGFVAGMAITFNVGAHGPYTVTVPEEGYTAAAVKAAVERRAAEIRMTLQ